MPCDILRKSRDVGLIVFWGLFCLLCGYYYSTAAAPSDATTSSAAAAAGESASGDEGMVR